MNSNQTPMPTERVGIGKRISNAWNSPNRIVRLITLVTLGLVLNCCCVIIPLSTKGTSLPAHAQVSGDAISAPASSAAQESLIPAASAISARMESDADSDGRAICTNFNSSTAARNQWDGSAKAGRACSPSP